MGDTQRVRGKLMCHAFCHALRINRTGKNLAHGDQRIGKVSFNTPNPNLGLRGPSAQRKKKKKKNDRRRRTTETPVQHSLTATGYLIISAAICSARSETASRSVCAISAWALEWLAGPDNKRSTPPSTPLAHSTTAVGRFGRFHGAPPHH